VNSASGELLKNGNRVKLQEQPFRLLVALLENAGEIVTREELRHRIWRDDTFVDFDSSLRVAVGKLRDALGDDAENPLLRRDHSQARISLPRSRGISGL
jgi:eukaryotic-like serine/threonine-protein kinase